MTGWTPKVFWKTVGTDPVDGGFAVTLDGRPIRTPGKAPLVLPTRALAQMVAAEWQAQAGTVRPETMPATRMANTAIDRIPVQRADVVAHLAAYGGSDLICYRAESPAGLVARQAEAWDPLIDWAAHVFGARLAVGRGIVHVPQDPAALARLADLVGAQDSFALAAFHDLVALSGSLVLALAVIHCARDPETAWALSRVDEEWQAEQWGRDEEAEDAAARKRAEFLFAARFHAAAGEGTGP